MKRFMPVLAVVLALSAACTSAPTPDAQATINAAVQATNVAQANVQATKDAAVKATAAAQPPSTATPTQVRTATSVPPTPTSVPPTATRTSTPVPPTPAPTVSPCTAERAIGEGAFIIVTSACSYPYGNSLVVTVSITGTRPFQGTGFLNETGNWELLCGVCWHPSNGHCVDAWLTDSQGTIYRDQGFMCSTDGKNLQIGFAVPSTANGLRFFYSDPQFDYPPVPVGR